MRGQVEGSQAGRASWAKSLSRKNRQGQTGVRRKPAGFKEGKERFTEEYFDTLPPSILTRTLRFPVSSSLKQMRKLGLREIVT